jgi:hypothetical protein
MAIRQTRIYAPATPPYDNHLWAETMMERIIKPLTTGQVGLTWYWFTRYASVQPEFADSDGSGLPSGFFGNQLCRSLRFRCEVDDGLVSAFEASGSQLIAQEGCWNADWREYGIGELCSNRFIGEDRSDARRDERLALVKAYVGSVSRMVLHAVVPADNQGRFRFEQNDDPLNAHGSAFFSLHHLFCNPTDVLLTALVVSNGNSLECGTRQYPPPLFVQNQTLPFVEVRVRF